MNFLHALQDICGVVHNGFAHSMVIGVLLNSGPVLLDVSIVAFPVFMMLSPARFLESITNSHLSQNMLQSFTNIFSQPLFQHLDVLCIGLLLVVSIEDVDVCCVGKHVVGSIAACVESFHRLGGFCFRRVDFGPHFLFGWYLLWWYSMYAFEVGSVEVFSQDSSGIGVSGIGKEIG